MKRSFSLAGRWQSIRYALAGVKAFFTGEPNAVIHLLSTILVVIMAGIFGVSATEALILVLVTGAVWAAELFNTAIEKTIDFVSKDKHPALQFIKDVAAAAVLVTAITALTAGLIIFLPKILLL